MSAAIQRSASASVSCPGATGSNPFSKALSATSRSAVAQVLSQLRAAGAITTARRSIEVVDIAKLESIDPLTLTTD